MASKCAICGGSGRLTADLLAHGEDQRLELPPALASALMTREICESCVRVRKDLYDGIAGARERWQSLIAMVHETAVRDYMQRVWRFFDPSSERMQQRMRELQDRRSLQLERVAVQQAAATLLITSGFNFEGYAITSYLGFLSEETAVGMGFFKGIAASISNVSGGESDSLRNKLLESKQIVMARLRQDAADLGANAIIGLDLDYTMFGDTILGVIVSGTAVTIARSSST